MKTKNYKLTSGNVTDFEWEDVSMSYQKDNINSNDSFQIYNNELCNIKFKRLFSPTSINLDLRIYQKNRSIDSGLCLNAEQLDCVINNLRKLRKLIS